MSIKRSRGEKVASVFINFTFAIYCLLAIVPFVLTFIVSISDENSVVKKGFSFFPDKFSLAGYKAVFSDSMIFNAYGVTLAVTVIGTIFSVLLCGLAGYAISVNKVKYRNKIALLFYIPMVFNAGLVPWYIVVTKVLMLKNSIFALILPLLISPFNIFLFRNYFKSIPAELAESAEIDGAGPFKTFFMVILPLSTPIIATISLFVSLVYWNDWVLALWMIDKQELFPLQYMLYRINSLISYMASNSGPGTGNIEKIPAQTTQMATLFVTIGPIILVYPFVQKYFVKGIMVGAVKG